MTSLIFILCALFGKPSDLKSGAQINVTLFPENDIYLFYFVFCHEKPLLQIQNSHFHLFITNSCTLKYSRVYHHDFTFLQIDG